MQYKNIKFIVILAIFSLPHIANADLEITEIMYDLEGTDTGYEWIEVYNAGDEGVDVISHTLFENDVQHKIVGVEGNSSASNSTLSPGEYSVIADKPTLFLEQNTSYHGLVFDSAFSLNNTGERVGIYTESGEETSSVLYSSDMGANGTGESIQIKDGNISVGLPSPGGSNTTSAIGKVAGASTKKSSDANTSNAHRHSKQVRLTTQKEATSLSIGIGRERVTTTNTPITFEAYLNKGTVDKVLWSFGDGQAKAGPRATYTYRNPGKYVVVANAKDDDIYATSRTYVTVIEPNISLEVDPQSYEVKILNNSKEEVNLGKYTLRYMNRRHVFPRDTILIGGGRITLPLESLYFEVLGKKSSKSPYISTLYYPNGEIVYSTE